MATNTSAPKQRQLTLDQVVNKYRVLGDEALLTKLFNQVASQTVLTKTGPLLKETQAEYKSCARILVHALADNTKNGGSRASLPSMSELLLRPHGPRLVTDLLVPACSDRRKVAIVACSLLARSFPELAAADRAQAQASWNACLRTARAQFEQQKRACAGYGGSLDANMPSWGKIQGVINSLQPGDPDRLILRFYAELKFRAPYCTNAVLMIKGISGCIGHLKSTMLQPSSRCWLLLRMTMRQGAGSCLIKTQGRTN